MAKSKTVRLNKTPGGSFTRDPNTEKLTRVESTKRETKETTKPATKSKES